MRKLFLYIIFCLFSAPVFAQNWLEVDGGITTPGYPYVRTLGIYQNELYVGGAYDMVGGNIQALGFAKWDGTNWFNLTTPSDLSVMAMTEYNNNLYIGGETFGAYKGIQIWDGVNFIYSGSGIPFGNIQGLTVYNNELYALGRFNEIEGSQVTAIARFDGTQWGDVGGGVSGSFGSVRTMAVYHNELYVGGSFEKAGGLPAYYIARWNGLSWDSVSGGVDGSPFAMVVDTVKDVLYVGGNFGFAYDSLNNMVPDSRFIVQWDGNKWTGMPGGDMIKGIKSLCMYRGELYAGGDGTIYSGDDSLAAINDTILARWDGTKWHPIIGPNGSIKTMKVYNDDLYIGGNFNNINGLPENDQTNDTIKAIARWHVPVGCNDYPVANFALDTPIIIQNDTIPFTDSSQVFTDPIASWLWEFGDGITSNLQNPFHVYTVIDTYVVKLTITSVKGCTNSMVRKIVVQKGTGVMDKKKETKSEISIYPNPATQSIHISYVLPKDAKTAEMRISDLTGKILNSKKLKIDVQDVYFDTSHLNKGLYFCELLINGKCTKSSKLIIN